MPESILERALLDGDLGAGLQMLHDAAAAYTEMRAAWRNAQRRWPQNLVDPGDLIRRFTTNGLGGHAFGRQCAFDKHDLAVAACNTPGLEVQGFDIQYFGHLLNNPGRYGQPSIVKEETQACLSRDDMDPFLCIKTPDDDPTPMRVTLIGAYLAARLAGATPLELAGCHLYPANKKT